MHTVIPIKSTHQFVVTIAFLESHRSGGIHTHSKTNSNFKIKCVNQCVDSQATHDTARRRSPSYLHDKPHIGDVIGSTLEVVHECHDRGEDAGSLPKSNVKPIRRVERPVTERSFRPARAKSHV